MKREFSLQPSDFEMLRDLLPMLAQAGISLPASSHGLPSLNARMPVHQLADELGRHAAPHNLFRWDHQLVTVDERTGEQRSMRPTRFITWIAKFVKLTKGEGNGESNLTREQAAVILESEVFQGHLRLLAGIHFVRLPVLRGDGSCELLPAGYDEASQIFTAVTLDYAIDWSLEKARRYLTTQLGQYPWSGGGNLTANRSAAVHLAAILGTYCRAFFPPGIPRPMIAYLANQEGSGKSTLATMALVHVHGTAPTTKRPKDDLAMDKELETVAQTRQPFVFFDDAGRAIFSPPLNRFITSTAHSGRVMGGNQEMFKAPAVTQVFVTGNDVKISPDLMRRAMVVELFLSEDARDRQFTSTITAHGLTQSTARQELLGACYALVRRWVAEGQRRHPAPLGSFEEWTGVIAAITQSAGFADPLAAPEALRGGDQEGAEFRELLCRLASGRQEDAVFTRQELVKQARVWGLLEELVGCQGDKPLNASQNIRLGRYLMKWRGRELENEQSRRFRFDHRRQKQGATYRIRFVAKAG